MFQSKTIFFIRHGQTDYNLKGIVQGSGIDSQLNDRGINQAQAFYNKYQDVNFELAICSALRRTYETILPFVNTGLAFERFGEINEINWGIHEGKTGNKEMIKQYKKIITSWKSGQYDARIPKGESAEELASRLDIFVNHLKKRPEKTLLVCSHGRAMRCLMCLLDGKDISEMEDYHHKNTGLYKVLFDGNRFNFELRNDVSHLG